MKLHEKIMIYRKKNGLSQEGFAIVVTGFQIIVGIACIIAGAVIIKKFKPKKESKK